MKKLMVAVAALALVGCNTATTTTGVSPVIYAAQDRVVIEGTRALILAHNAYQGASAAMIPVVQSGRLSNAQLDRLQSISDRAVALLEQGGTGVDAAGRAAEVLEIVSEIHSIIGR